MSRTYENPAVISLAKALGTNPREIRKNFESLVYGMLRFLSDSSSVRICNDFMSGLDDNVRQHSPPLAPEALSTLYKEAVKTCPPWTDVLGAVHANVLTSSNGEGLGQYFTPEDLAQLTAAIAHDHMKDHPPKKTSGAGAITIHEPTVGAGGLVLAQLEEAGDDDRRYVIDAWDIDPLCCAMTSLQVLANVALHSRSVAGIYVREGNVLTKQHKIFWMGISGSVVRAKLA